MKQKKAIILILCSLLLASPYRLAAQDEDFETFRKNLLNEYQDFRSQVLTDYQKYLNEIWVDYETFKAKPRPQKPKPVAAPVATPQEQPPTPVTVEPVTPPATVPDVPQPARPVPVVKPRPTAPARPPVTTFPYYGISIGMPQRASIPQLVRMEPAKVSKFWKELNDDPQNSRVSDALKERIVQYRLNDWLAYRLVMDYVRSALPAPNEATRYAYTHYLLVSLGYDARLGSFQGRPLLLLPVKETVYDKQYATIDGHNYYMFSDFEGPIPSFSSCPIPKEAKVGEIFSLSLSNGPQLLPKQHSFTLAHGGLSIQGSYNENLITMMDDYPHTDIALYAGANVDANCHKQIVEQLKQQLQGKGELESLNQLLHFVQNAFEYATDGEQFGYEKPFFFEELLHYPKCDCEDRSIFFSYLVKNVLGLHCHLLDYPGHIAVAVALSQPFEGDGYVYQGKHYYISDPTYIGASVGECMPKYRNVTPKLIFWY